MTAEFGGLDTSPLYETEPVGGPEQDPYLNAIVVFESDVTPDELLDFLHTVEQSQGRERKVKWGPRTLDLDIVTSDSPPLSGDRLTIPHPRAAEREFVLRPLVEVWPEARVNGGRSAVEALESLPEQGVDLLSRQWYPETKRWVGNALVTGQLALFIGSAVALAYDGTLPEGKVTVLRVLGATLAMAGLIIAFLSTRRLGTSMTANPVPKSGGSLVIAGPYRYVRHPIYGGVILVLVGTAMFLDSLAGVIVGLTLLVYFWFKTQYEERQLRMRYAGYSTYRSVVHRRLIPFVI